MAHKITKMKTIRLFLIAILLGVGSQIMAQECPPASTGKLVNDFANVLTDQEEKRLSQKLVNFANETSNQIVIVTHPDLCGDAPYNFATELGQKWGVGQKDLDNGLVVVFKPKTASSRGQAFIAPGFGLEGAIPDATAKSIVDNEMIPHFKQNNTYSGLDAAVNVLMSLAKGEINADSYAKKNKKDAVGIGVALFFFLGIFGLIFLVRAGRARRYASTNDLGFWTAFWLIGSSSGHGGYYNNFSSGSGGFGGGSGGGGFGGFGGGGFGGGGAGGSW